MSNVMTDFPDGFDTDVRQLRDFYVRSDRLDKDRLRAKVLETITSPWHDPDIGDRDENGLWTWFRLERVSDENLPRVQIVLHAVDGGLKLTDAVPAGSAGQLDHDTYNRVVTDFHSRFATSIAEGGNVRTSLSQPSAPLADWVGDEAVRALARFSHTANRSGAAGHPKDEERWLDFLHLALPRAKVGFTEALRQALVNNGWPEDTADKLVAQAELVDAYERLGRERYRRSA